jgi:hypothetical protein
MPHRYWISGEEKDIFSLSLLGGIHGVTRIHTRVQFGTSCARGFCWCSARGAVEGWCWTVGHGQICRIAAAAVA